MIAYAHKTHAQTREIMTLGYEFNRLNRATNSVKNAPLFLLPHQEPNNNNSTIVLKKTLAQLPRPFDLWIVNFPRAKAELAKEIQNCVADSQRRPKVNGYKYKLYHCQ